jgi:type I restriction enzyme S subunit
MKKGWQTKQLSDASAINYGYTESASSEPVGPRFLRITDIQEDRVDWDSVPFCKIESADLPKYRLDSGDIVFARTGATTGKSFLVNDPPEAVFASYLIRLRLLDTQLLPKFVSLFFQTPVYWQLIKEGSSGSAQGGFNATKLGALRIPIPPLAEQRRIVAVLDEAFAGLATAQAHAEKNLQNARELFDSYLNEVFTKRGNDEVEKRLKEFVDDISTGPFGSLLHKSDYEVGGIPLVNPINIVDRSVVPDERKAVGKATAKRLSRYALQEDDIVIGRRGEIGRCAVISADQAGWLCGTGSFFIRPSNETDPHFLGHLLRSQHYRKQLEQLSDRATMPSISNSDLANLVIAVPAVQRQKKIVSLLDELVEETQRLESVYEHKRSAINELKKSLLHQAFSGEL